MLRKLLTTTALAVGAVAGFAPAAAAHEMRLHGYLGSSFMEDTDLDDGVNTGSLSFDNGFIVGIGIGIDTGDWVFEGEYVQRNADFDEITINGLGSVAIPDSDIEISAFMANAWYQLSLGSALDGYVGGGLGLGKAEISVGPLGLTGESDDELVWQLGAGVGHTFSDGLYVGVGYRYFQVPEIEDADIDFSTNDVIFEIAKTF